jgi:hypothetical protein
MNKFEPCVNLQPFESDPVLVESQGVKLGKVVQRRCIYRPGNVLSYTHYFSVLKGTDSRMVYDASKSGLNSCIWVPRFPLPNVDTHLCSVEPGTWMGDLDVGKMFLKFPLHTSLKALCGVDLTQYEKFVDPNPVVPPIQNGSGVCITGCGVPWDCILPLIRLFDE